MSSPAHDDVRSLLTRAVPDGEPLPMAEILHRADHRRRARSRTRFALVALLVVLAGGALLAVPGPDLRFGGPGGAPETVLPLPPRGAVVPEFLRDGTPVFVGRAEEGQVFVVEARSPDSDDVDVLVGWCATAGLFEAYVGSRFDMAGHYLGGPAPVGLTPRAAEMRQGGVHVGAAKGAPPREAVSPVRRARSGDDCFETPRAQGSAGAGYVGHHLDRLDDAVWPEQLAERGSDVPVLVVGTIERVGNTPPRVCTPMPNKDDVPTVCAGATTRLAPTTFSWFREDFEAEEGQIFGVYGAFLMTAADGVLTLHTVLPGTIEHGGWVPGTAPYEREGRLRLWEEVADGWQIDGLRAEPPPLVMIEDDDVRRAQAIYPEDDVVVFGGPVLTGVDGQGIPSTWSRLLEVLRSGAHPHLRFVVTWHGATDDATSISEVDP